MAYGAILGQGIEGKTINASQINGALTNATIDGGNITGNIAGSLISGNIANATIPANNVTGLSSGLNIEIGGASLSPSDTTTITTTHNCIAAIVCYMVDTGSSVYSGLFIATTSWGQLFMPGQSTTYNQEASSSYKIVGNKINLPRTKNFVDPYFYIGFY